MTKKTYSSLGLDLAFEVPSSVEEFDLNAGGGTFPKSGACLDEGINNIIYRGSLTDFRQQFLEKVEEQTGIERKTEPTGKKVKVKVKAADGTVTEVEEDGVRFAETEAVYFNRVLAEKNVKAESFKDLAQSVADSIKFDASATERAPATPKTAGKVYLAAADQLIASGNAAAVAAKLTTILGETVSADRDSLAKGIQLHEARKRAEEQKKLAANMQALLV